MLNVTKDAQCVGLALLIGVFAAYFHCMIESCSSLRIFPAQHLDVADIGEDVRFGLSVVCLAGLFKGATVESKNLIPVAMVAQVAVHRRWERYGESGQTVGGCVIRGRIQI